jgi:alpha-L-fucosidase
MKRRDFLTNAVRSGVAVALLQHSPVALAKSLASEDGESLPPPRAIPSADQVAWQHMEVGMFIHFAPNTWQGLESDDLSTPLSEINPKDLDTDKWAQAAVDLGAKYIVFVAKHQGGFCMFQTHTTDYGIRNTPWRDGKGDVLADMSASCKKYGLRLGVYLCPRDDHFGAKTGGVCATPELQAKYDAMYREQLTEVLSRYGPMVEAWFDGSSATPVADILTKYQPHAMVFQGPSATIRWVGNEDGYAPYPCWNGIDRVDAKAGTSTALNSNPDGDVWIPNEVDVSIRRPNWFWSDKPTNRALKQEQLMSIYYRSVGRGAQLLLNVPPNRDGVIPEPDVALLKSFGDEIKRRFSQPLAQKSGTGSTLTLDLQHPLRIDTVVLQEDIRGGERVRAYTLEGRSDGRWNALGRGTAIGNKRIQPVDPVTIDAVRLTITQHAGLPRIGRLAVFNTGVAPPENWDAEPQLWAPNTVGKWRDHAFSLNLTKHIDAAKQYRLRFVPRAGSVTTLSDVVLKLHGVAEPNLVKKVKDRSSELILDITEVSDSVTIEGRVEGAEAGEVLLQKL